MTRLRFVMTCLTWLCCLLPTHGYAATIEIGRASVELPAGVWKQVASSEGQTLLDNGFTGTLSTDDRAFVLMEGEQALAILLISSSRGGAAAITNWSTTCLETQNSYANNFSGDFKSLACAKATGRLHTLTYLRLAVPKMFKALDALAPILPPITHSVSAVVGNRNGTMLRVNLVAAPAFAGISASKLGNVPSRVNPQHAAWADRLGLALHDSVYSMSGKLVVPAVVFGPALTPTPAPAQVDVSK